MAPTIARLVHYRGHVQGVGFRASAVDIARGFAVGGWVRNLPDGRVQLSAEGAPAAVEGFLRAVRERWADAITEEQQQDQTVSGIRGGGFVIAR